MERSTPWTQTTEATRAAAGALIARKLGERYVSNRSLAETCAVLALDALQAAGYTLAPPGSVVVQLDELVDGLGEWLYDMANEHEGGPGGGHPFWTSVAEGVKHWLIEYAATPAPESGGLG